MALTQFTQQFIANLPIINEQTLKDFYVALFRAPVKYRINFISETINKQKDSLPKIDWCSSKDDIKSQNFRITGNECFVRLEFVEALKYYNRAIGFAKSDENLSICYANRSAVYFELSLFDLCLENIELARRHKLPDKFKARVDHRQEAAVTHLLSKLAIEAKCTYNMKLCRPPRQRQPFLIDCLSKEYNLMLTKEALAAGDVISLEKPYCQILRSSHIYERCTYCLKNNKYMSMIPCTVCTSAMFCNQYCYEMARQFFHGFECCIIDGLYHFLPDFIYLGLRATLMTLSGCGIVNYRRLLLKCFSKERDPFEVNVTKDNKIYQELIYLAIHNLKRSRSFSIQHHLATAVLMGQLTSNFRPLFDKNPGFKTILAASLFHMIQVSMENGVLLEETASVGDHVDDDDDITIYGCALFPFGSTFKLSCAPNVLFVNRSGMLTGIVIRPIKAGEAIKPGLMSQNHFLSDLELRISRMKTFTTDLCHCVACVQDFETFAELPQPLVVLLNNQYSPIPEKTGDDPITTFKSLCNYINGNRNIHYLSWQMGWYVDAMIRVLRQLVNTYDTNSIFTQYSRVRRND